MPRTRTRSVLRAVSRDEQRALARPNPAAWQSAPATKTTLFGRAERRKHHWRGDIATLVHARRPMRRHLGGLLTGRTIPTSGQVRIDAKRNARADYWADYWAERAQPEPIAITDGAAPYRQREHPYYLRHNH